jgi:hypothetical protein
LIEITLVEPFGSTGRLQSGLFSKREATAMELWLYQLPLTKPDAVRAILDRRFGPLSLQTVYSAHVRGRLDELLSDHQNPLLSVACLNFRSVSQAR